MEYLSVREMILVNGGDQDSYDFGWYMGKARAHRLIAKLRALKNWLNEVEDRYVEEHGGVFENCD